MGASAQKEAVDAPRYCQYRFCSKSLKGRRPDCKYCTEAHKAAEHRLRLQARLRAALAVRPASSGPRRGSRDGRGTRIYITTAEIDLLRGALGHAHLRPESTSRRNSLRRKLNLAAERAARKEK